MDNITDIASRQTPRARYVAPQRRNLRTQNVFRYDRTGGGLGGAEIVTDQRTVEVLKDAIDLATRHLFSPRSLEILNQALSAEVAEFSEWLDHGPRLTPFSEQIPFSRSLAEELARRVDNDGMQLVVDRTLEARGIEGCVNHQRPSELRINAARVESVVHFQQVGNPCETAALVYVANIICHEAVHALRRLIVDSHLCSFDSPPQIRSQSSSAWTRGPLQNLESSPGVFVEVRTGEGGFYWEECYWGGIIRRVLVPLDDSGDVHRPIDALAIGRSNATGADEFVEITEASLESINRASDEDLEKLPVDYERGYRRWPETYPHMARRFASSDIQNAPQHAFDQLVIAPRGCEHGQ